MTLVGTAHGQRDLGYRQGGGAEKLPGARQAAPDYVLVRRKSGRLLENVRKMIWVQLERFGHVDEHQPLTEVAVNEDNDVLHSLLSGSFGFGHDSLPRSASNRNRLRMQRGHARAIGSDKAIGKSDKTIGNSIRNSIRPLPVSRLRSTQVA